MWRDTRSAQVWWRASATARSGVGCTKMPSGRGSTAGWIFPRDPHFQTKAGRILDLYERRWQGQPLREDEYVKSVISTAEKPSIQARLRIHSEPVDRTRRDDARGARVCSR